MSNSRNFCNRKYDNNSRMPTIAGTPTKAETPSIAGGYQGCYSNSRDVSIRRKGSNSRDTRTPGKSPVVIISALAESKAKQEKIETSGDTNKPEPVKHHAVAQLKGRQQQCGRHQ